MIVKIDMDGVIRDILTPMCDIYNDLCKENVQPKDINVYNVNEFFVKMWDEFLFKPSDHFFNYMADDVFLNKSKPYEGVRDAILRLKENGFKVIIVTWQESLKNKLLALEFLNRYDIPYDDICFTRDKYLIQGDILIDDNPEFLDDPRDKSLKLCVEYAYNSHIRSALKVDSLEDAVDLLLTEV